MSKSKKNVIDPIDIIDQFGADTARWFVMSDSPPERDIKCYDSGIHGYCRFCQKKKTTITSNLTNKKEKIEEFKSKKEENRPKRLKVQNDGWRMVIELVTGMVLGVSLGMALDYIVGSEPIFLIVFSLLGFMAGVKTMIATAKKMNETNN